MGCAEAAGGGGVGVNLACRISSRVDAAVSSPWACPAYLAARVVMWRTLPVDTITLLLSDLSILLLLLMATAQAKRSTKQERQLDELARVNPEIDDRAIAADG